MEIWICRAGGIEPPSFGMATKSVLPLNYAPVEKVVGEGGGVEPPHARAFACGPLCR